LHKRRLHGRIYCLGTSWFYAFRNHGVRFGRVMRSQILDNIFISNLLNVLPEEIIAIIGR